MQGTASRALNLVPSLVLVCLAHQEQWHPLLPLPILLFLRAPLSGGLALAGGAFCRPGAGGEQVRLLDASPRRDHRRDGRDALGQRGARRPPKSHRPPTRVVLLNPVGSRRAYSPTCVVLQILSVPKERFPQLVSSFKSCRFPKSVFPNSCRPSNPVGSQRASSPTRVVL
eukprot:6189394-Pleurochrysis_carterae.AAC.5